MAPGEGFSRFYSRSSQTHLQNEGFETEGRSHARRRFVLCRSAHFALELSAPEECCAPTCFSWSFSCFGVLVVVTDESVCFERDDGFLFKTGACVRSVNARGAWLLVFEDE